MLKPRREVQWIDPIRIALQRTLICNPQATHSLFTKVGSDNHVINFSVDKAFGLVELGKRDLMGLQASGVIVIPTVSVTYFLGLIIENSLYGTRSVKSIAHFCYEMLHYLQLLTFPPV